MRTIVIPKGSHMAINDFTFPRYGGITKKFRFGPTCRYDVGDLQSSWNKLFGMSWGFFPLIKQWMQHGNSSRFAWRYNRGSDKIEVCAYYYVDGVRYYPEIDGRKWQSLEIDKEYTFKISVYDNHAIYIVEEDGIMIFYYCIPQKIPSLWGFSAPIYFGGTAVPNHTILIDHD